MRLAVNDINREPLGTASVDESARPSSITLDGGGRTILLQWEGALDEQGRLRRCPVCGCREIFRRQDFPQRLGLILVIGTIIAAVVLIALWQVIWAMGVLLAAVVIDRIICVFTRECLVCYRCRTEFRGVTIDGSHEAWNLATGEKYRPIRRIETPRQDGPCTQA